MNKAKKHLFYESSQTNYHEVNGEAEGIRKTVSIENGVGLKKVEKLGQKGVVVGSKTRKLSNNEISNITNGNFVPGLWSNCKLGNCSNRKTLKNSNKNSKATKRK
jgi:hypothetical protein